MKRWLNLLLMLCLLVTLCACRAGSAAASSGTPDSNAVHTHSYGAWTMVAAPTCTRDGNEMAACACGHNTTRLIEAKGHSFVDWTIVKAGTCTTEGYETSICANGCGAVENRATDFMHTYGPWTAYREYTHGDWWEGERRYCTCGIWEERQHEHVFDVLVEVVAPNCGNDGYTLYKCACDDPGRMMDNIIKATGKHTFGKWKPHKEYIRGDWWEGERRYCACGAWEEREHVHAFNVLVEEKAPTCGNQGHQVFKCACDDGGHMTTYIDPTGEHTFGPWTVSVAPSLVTFGEECRNCTVCGKIEYREMAP